VVDAPKGKKVRPSTADCFKEWLTLAPEPGDALMSSSPIVWPYQHLNALNELKGIVFVTTICHQEPALEESPRLVSLVKDTAAKCFYEIERQSQLK
jgi:hypothetical protein